MGVDIGVHIGSGVESGIEFGMGLATDLGLGCYELSSPASNVRALIVPTDEELMIARDTSRVLQTWICGRLKNPWKARMNTNSSSGRSWPHWTVTIS